jgi:hypothetical protein
MLFGDADKRLQAGINTDKKEHRLLCIPTLRVQWYSKYCTTCRAGYPINSGKEKQQHRYTKNLAFLALLEQTIIYCDDYR